MRLATVRRTRFAAGSARPTPRRASGKGGGLTMDRATGGFEFIFELIDLVSQPIALAPQLVPLAAQPIHLAFGVRALAIPFRLFSAQSFNLPLLPLQFGDQIVTRRGAPTRTHALVMPRFDLEYK
jgi:hypothetical protein